VYYTLDGTQTGGTNGYATESEITQNDITWMVTGNTTMNPWRIGGKGNASRPIYSTSTLSQDITKVVVTNGTANLTVNSMTLVVSSNSDFSNPTTTVSGSWAASNTTTFERPSGADWSNKYFKLIYDVSASSSSNQYAQLVKVEFYYNAGGNPTCATPTFSPDAGTYTSAQNVTISTATSGATIYYTTDGTTPTTSSSVYSSAIPVSTTTTIKAIATATGYDNSSVASATYTIVTLEHAGTEADPYTVADARAAIDAGLGTQSVYATGIVTAIPTAYSTQYSNITFNFVDTEEDTEFLQAYRCGGDDAANVQVGDVVVVYGNLTKYNSTYEFAQGCTLVSLEHPAAAVEAPTFSPAAGTYETAQSVTLSTTTTGATIYYTTDGTEPTSASTQYTSAISVSTTTTIKAIAIKGSDESTVATATYHICSAANPYTVTQALAFNEYPANGIYVTGIVSTAPTQNPTSNGELTYYISADGEATNQLEVYKGKGLEQAAFTAQDDIQVGDIVTIYGNVQVYNSTIEFGSGNYLVAFERPVSTEPSVTVTPATINAPYEGADGTLALAYENITDFISFDYYFCDDEGNELQEVPDWIFAEIQEENDSYSLYYVIDANDGEARTAYIKVYTFDDELEEVSSIVTVTQAAYVAPVLDYASLPFEFDGGRADIANTDGLTQEGLDSDYNSSPKLKFNGTGDYVVLAFDERPGKLTFDIKGNGFSEGTFTVQTSEDGVTYTDLESYTELGATQSEEFNNLGENVRYIKWVYTEKVNGNVALGNIKLAKYGTVAAATVNVGTLTNVTSVEMWDEDMNDIEDGDEVTAGLEVFVKPTAATGYTVESVTVVDADNNNVTVTANSGNWSFIMPNKSVTVSATATSGSVTPVAGDKYVKVTSTADLTDGQYLIVCENQNVAFDGGRDNDTDKLDAASNTISVTISNNEIVADATTNAAAFTIDMTNGTILSASGFYIGQTSNANGLQASDETEYENAISINEDGDADVVSSSAYLRYNAASNQTRFRYFKSSTYTGQEAIQLYKFVAAPTSQTVTVSAAGYATFVAEADLQIPAGVEVFAVQVNEAATSAHLEPITAGIPADEAVLVRASAGDYVFPYATEAVDPISDNDLFAATAPVTADGTQYCLANKTEGVGFYQVQSGQVIPAGKAYLVVEAPAEGSAKAFYGFDDNATGLNNVDVNVNEAIYNLAGQRLSKMQNGINIVNGKKVLK
jgi:hypothetical protein